MKAKIADRYQIIEKIGEGAYGKVYLAKDNKYNRQVAIKKMKLSSVEEGVPISTLREISLLKELNHVNVIKLLDIIHLENRIILVFEYCQSDLQKVLQANNYKGIAPAKYKSYLYQLLKGIKYVHKLKILHRDLKTENLFITENNILKIGDFGLARGYGLPMSVFRNDVVSLWYRSLDILLGNEAYTTSVDMWSVGCIFAEMVNGDVLFYGKSEDKQIEKIVSILGTPDVKAIPMFENLPGYKERTFESYPKKSFKEICPSLDDNGIDLLSKMLDYDPEKRIKADEALKHPFFKDIDQVTLNLYKDE